MTIRRAWPVTAQYESGIGSQNKRGRTYPARLVTIYSYLTPANSPSYRFAISEIGIGL